MARTTGMIALTILIFIALIFNGAFVEAQTEENSYTIEIYDHDTGEYLGSGELRTIAEEDNIFEDIPLGFFAWDRLQGRVGINTAIPIASRIELDADDKRIYIQVSGPDNTTGKLALFASPNLVSSPENVEVYLDNQLIGFTTKTVPEGSASPEWVVIIVEYTYSTHTLMFQLTPEVSKPWHSQPLYLALITLAIIVAIGAVYWLKFRRRAP